MNSETSYPKLLRKLSNDYYQKNIGIEEYRVQRKILLDKIDAQFNAEQINAEAEPTENQ